MNLKNYTSSVPVERTVARIEEALTKAGANSIMKDYHEGRLSADGRQTFYERLRGADFAALPAPKD